jgi:hypothetical protein
MAVPAQILQTVQTYQMSNLAYLQNLCCFVSTSNAKFRDFDRMTANLGDTVTFDLPPRFTTTASLVANFQPANQRVQALSVRNQISTSYAFSDQQFLFNVREYMERFGTAAMAEMGAKIEAVVASNCDFQIVPASSTTAAFFQPGPYRFYGDGLTPINTYNQLAQALALFRNYGSVTYDVKGYLSDIAVAQIVGSGLNQFALDRNDKEALSWQVGAFSGCEWYQSNLLPVHIAGNIGNQANGWAGRTLTISAIGAPLPDGSINSITVTSGGAVAADPNAILQGDRMQFIDGVAGQPDMRYLTFIGQLVSSVPVQIQSTVTAASNGAGAVTFTFNPPLQALATSNQNINNALAVGMQLQVVPNCRVGMINGGNSLYLAMPQLPALTPYPTGNSVDPDTGVSLRQYYGSLFGQNVRGMIHDCIHGSVQVPEYGMAMLFPL